MIRMPQTLIQIHYHNGLGGVTRVVRQYEQAFKRISRTGHSLFFSADRNGRNDTSVAGAECDYACYENPESFEAVRHRIYRKLQNLIKTCTARPVLIICHNLSLGKNVALSAAVADVAGKYQHSDEIIFYWVIHDLVEEGRMDLLERVNRLEDMGAKPWNHLYPCKGVQYVVLNRRDEYLLKKCMIGVKVLPNHIPSPRKIHSGVIEKTEQIIRRACPTSRSSSDRPIFFYPVRVISRKNVIEAIILAVLKQSGILVLGGEGSSPGDISFSEKLRNFCRVHGLDVIFDIQSRAQIAGVDQEDVFPACYSCCDWCLTTSIAEGFGYSLYEPWAYGTPVIGRAPEGFHCSGKIVLHYLYRSFEIPITWISIDRLFALYDKHLKPFGSDRKQAIGRAKEALEKKGSVDFGLLDHMQQFSILERLVMNLDEAKQLESPLHRQMEWIRSRIHIISDNRSKIETYFTTGFDKRFKRCYMNGHVDKNNTIFYDLSPLRSHFMKPHSSRILLAAKS
ncbi:MAG: hypothetical protein ACLFSB_04165 [Chitinispirillaceae bacterium]